jgi:hypothetical protein
MSQLAQNIEYVESGEGPAVLFLPGSFGSIPDAALTTLDGGSHFLPTTHAADLAVLIASHVRGTVKR